MEHLIESPDDVPWMELIAPLGAEISRLVKELWQQGDTHQNMGRRPDYRPPFTPVVSRGNPLTGWMEQSHSLQARCNELSSTISAAASQRFTSCFLATMDDPVDDDRAVAD